MIKKSSSNHKMIFFAVFILISIFFISACSSNVEPTETVTDENDAFLEQEVSASGELVPALWMTLSSANGAMDIEILVEEGDPVEEGAILAKINDSQIEAAYFQALSGVERAKFAYDQVVNAPSDQARESANAAYVNAQTNLKRQKDIGASQSVIDAAQADFDAAKANLDAVLEGASAEEITAAEYDLKAAELVLDQARDAFDIRSPIDGTIVEIYIQSGEPTSPMQPIFLVADLSSFKVVTTDLSEVDVLKLEEGGNAEIVFDAISDQTFPASIEKIAQISNGVSSVYYEVTLTLNEEPQDLKWGLSAFVLFELD
jgi:multidrug efflux pump subunit AcrA (membrane-fusion protein)